MAGANEVSSLILPLTETIWTKFKFFPLNQQLLEITRKHFFSRYQSFLFALLLKPATFVLWF